MSADTPVNHYYDKQRVVRFTAMQRITRIVITAEAWEKAAAYQLLQEQVNHILEQDPIIQANKGYCLKPEPTLGGYVFHTPDAGMYLLAETNQAVPEELIFDRLKKPKH